jgi:L-rhamnose-H+ transport protein
MIVWFGLAAAGLLNGSFAVPMKTAKHWRFEHIWAVFSLLAMALVPWLIVWTAVPGWRALVDSLPPAGLARLAALGLMWGGASLLYGLAVQELGVALGMSIQLGLSIVAGALLPRLWTAQEPAPALFYLGLAAMLAGVFICARAGREDSGEGKPSVRFRRGILIAVAGGLGAPLLNVGIQYGGSLVAGTRTESASGQWVVWALFLSAACVTQSGVCFARVWMRGTQRAYFSAPSEWMRVVVMAVVWAASIFLYAFSASGLGPRGTSIGWPIFIGLIVVTSNAWGVALGEWSRKPGARFRQMLAGSALLIAATAMVAQGR